MHYFFFFSLQIVPLFKVIVCLWYIINTIKNITCSGCVCSLKWMLARFFSKFWKRGANSCKLPWQMCFTTNKVCPDSLIVTSNISLLVPQKRWVEMSGRKIAPQTLPTFRLSHQHVRFWRWSVVMLCTCDIALAFLILQAMERPQSLVHSSCQCLMWHLWIYADYPAPSWLKKKKKKLYWAQKVAARLSSAQVSGNGVGPNSKQAYLLSQKHCGARGINMQ